MIFPIHTVIFAGRKEKNNTSAKKISEKMNNTVVPETFCPSIGSIPVVNDVVAHLGMAKNGPMVRYNRQVKK